MKERKQVCVNVFDLLLPLVIAKCRYIYVQVGTSKGSRNQGVPQTPKSTDEDWKQAKDIPERYVHSSAVVTQTELPREETTV